MVKRYTGRITLITNGKEHSYYSNRIMAMSEACAEIELEHRATRDFNLKRDFKIKNIEVCEWNEWD